MPSARLTDQCRVGPYGYFEGDRVYIKFGDTGVYERDYFWATVVYVPGFTDDTCPIPIRLDGFEYHHDDLPMELYDYHSIGVDQVLETAGNIFAHNTHPVLKKLKQKPKKTKYGFRNFIQRIEGKNDTSIHATSQKAKQDKLQGDLTLQHV